MSTSQITLTLGRFRTGVAKGGLRRSLLQALVAILLVTFVLISVGVLLFVAKNEQAIWQERQREAADYAGETVAGFIGRVQDYMILAGSLPSAQITQNPDILQRYLDGNSSVLEIIRTDAGGHVVAKADRGQPILSNFLTLSQSNWFQQALNGQFYIGDLQISSQDEPYMITSAPSNDGGVVAARLRMNLLWEVVARIQFGQTGRAYVITDKGQIIAHATPQVVLANTTLAGRPEMSALAATPDKRWSGSYTNLQGEYVLGVTQPVPETGWIIITELPQKEALAISRRALTVLLFGIAVFGILAIGLTFSALQRLVLSPIEALRATVLQVGQGEFHHQVAIYRQDEVGQVAQVFNEMVTNLNRRDQELAAKTSALASEILEHKKTQDELEQLNRTLEQRVKDRTIELEKLASDLTSSNKELQEFAYVASHDLQEPLRKVRAFGDRLVEKYNHVLDARGQDYITRMQNGAARMQVLIDALLTYSRVSTKAQPFVPVNLQQVTKGVLSDLEHQIERVGGQVEVEELDIIKGDPLQLRQLLQNLVSNGLKFHQPNVKPIVKISGEWIETQDAAASNQRAYRLVVQDNGIGISDEYSAQIFQVFQRLHGRNEYEGAGIGLAICRKIVERHQGTIVVKSAPGEGATFIITFPDIQPGQTILEEQ